MFLKVAYNRTVGVPKVTCKLKFPLMKSSYWLILVLGLMTLLFQSFHRLDSWFLSYVVSEQIVGLSGAPCARGSEAQRQSIQGLELGRFMPWFCCFCHFENIAQEQAFYTHNSKSTLVRTFSFKFHLFTGILSHSH